MRRAALVAMCATFAALTCAQHADAHAYLLRTTPAVGAVIPRAPAGVLLAFSEAIAPAPGIDVTGPDGTSALGRRPLVPDGHPAQIVLPLRSGLPDGTYTVSWGEIDQEDGHQTSGSFSFAVGEEPAAPVVATEERTGFHARGAAGRWLLLTSILMAAGLAAFRRLVWLSEPHEPEIDARERRVAAIALAVALVLAATAAGALLALQPDPLSTRYGQRMLVGCALAAAAAACAVGALRRSALLGAAELGAVLLLTLPTLTGHAVAAGESRALSIPGDLVHVVAAAVWVGGLASLAVLAPFILRSMAAADRPSALATLGRRFSPFAAAAATALAETGLVRAAGELDRLSQLWTASYGRMLLLKTGLFCLALGLGVLHRRRPGVGGPLRRAARGELALVAIVVVAAAALASMRPGRDLGPALADARPTTGSAAVFAGHVDDLAVGLAVSPVNDGSIDARATVLAPAGARSGLGLRVLTGGRSYPAAVCGPGCYRARVPIAKGAPELAVVLSVPHRKPRVVRFSRPEIWPAPPAAGIVRRAERTFRRLRTLTVVSRLASGSTHAVTTIWRFQAPDRLSYRNLPGGSEAVIVGSRRWDRESAGAPWRQSGQDPVRQPAAPWSSRFRLAHLLGSGAVDGQPVWRVSFVDPTTPAWFTIFVAKGSYRTLRVDMVAAAHFMRERNTEFNAPLQIARPERPVDETKPRGVRLAKDLGPNLVATAKGLTLAEL